MAIKKPIRLLINEKISTKIENKLMYNIDLFCIKLNSMSQKYSPEERIRSVSTYKNKTYDPALQIYEILAVKESR